MGGRPRFALLSLGLPKACPSLLVDQFMAGFQAALGEYEVALVGGDTVSAGENLMLSVTVCGEMREDKVCYRSAAATGDQVWVSGCLGDAACGLELCRRGVASQGEYAALYGAHLDPQPQVRLGAVLAESGLIHAMMDISDGLATDLAHICLASGVGAEVMAGAVPLSDELRRAADLLGLAPLSLALQGGEDYQLVFTAPAENNESLQTLCLQAGMKIFCVGRIIGGNRVMLSQDTDWRDITFGGYEHRF
jgi:thiamine-monophosphate kinase